ncbi:hypothetical protein LCGC14_1064240 [marine sediment metagenome]|uniref:DUF4365 domain-containing protein n=2 Tax=root TaxID=1 RepID=A0A831QUB8_9FLAO|nr:hypothetical protein [Pricia antarctica]
MGNFKELDTTKLGEYAESLVVEYLIEVGYNIATWQVDASHPFDILATKTNHYADMFIVEVKAKAHRWKYPDTGFDLDDFEKYVGMSIPVKIFFVDPEKGKMYGNTLDNLIQKREVYHKGEKIEYPIFTKAKEGDSRYKAKVFFPLEAMLPIADLREDEIKKLKSMTSSNHSKKYKTSA